MEVWVVVAPTGGPGGTEECTAVATYVATTSLIVVSLALPAPPSLLPYEGRVWKISVLAVVQRHNQKHLIA